MIRVDCIACDNNHDIDFDCMKEVLMTTVTARPCDKRVLAAWVREDGFAGLAGLIESTPPAVLPSVLRWTAKHIAKHPHYTDEEAQPSVGFGTSSPQSLASHSS